MVPLQSLSDLSARYWWRKLKVLRAVARTPDVTRIRVITTSDVSFSWVLARSQDNNGLIFIDSKKDLPREVAHFGAPIHVEDVAQQKLRLVLVHGDEDSIVTWSPTIAELLDGKPLPDNVSRAWRESLAAEADANSLFKHPERIPGKLETAWLAAMEEGFSWRKPLRGAGVFLDNVFNYEAKKVHLQAVSADGAWRESIVFGNSVRSLVGLGKIERFLGGLRKTMRLLSLDRFDRLHDFAHRGPAPQAIPISDTEIVRLPPVRDLRSLLERIRVWALLDVRSAGKMLQGRLIYVSERMSN